MKIENQNKHKFAIQKLNITKFNIIIFYLAINFLSVNLNKKTHLMRINKIKQKNKQIMINDGDTNKQSL